jgi:hypothetical protein
MLYNIVKEETVIAAVVKLDHLGAEFAEPLATIYQVVVHNLLIPSCQEKCTGPQRRAQNLTR